MMPRHDALTTEQKQIIDMPLNQTLFLEGLAGSGKTTAGVGRLAHLLAQGVPSREVLVLVPQQTLANPYRQLLNRADLPAGAEVSVTTIGGLVRRMVDLFWPLVAQAAGFAEPQARPTFLSLETAQYYMGRVIGSLIVERGYFESITIDRVRLYSQILDNLNKAALVRFPHTEIGDRLNAAWAGDEAQRRMYDDVQACASAFRAYCLAHNLLDFSLQAELFFNQLWMLPQPRAYLVKQYRHLIVDNIEEDSPAVHDLLRDWLPVLKSALVIYDHEAGYRRFLGADDRTAYTLRSACVVQMMLTHDFVTSPALRELGAQFALSLKRTPAQPETSLEPREALREALHFEDHRYHPQVMDWVVAEIGSLVRDHGVPPGEIVVVAPYLSDALRFSLLNRFAAAGVPARSHRPSRALRDEPAAVCLLTLARLAHSAWEQRPTTFDVAYALMMAIDGLDLVRAQLLAQIVYRPRDGVLGAFDQINTPMQTRITYRLGGQYERLRAWLGVYQAGEPDEIDHFWRRLFGEVLSQASFGFHGDTGAAEVAANLIESAQRFRLTIGVPPEGKTLAQEYVEMVTSGVLADQYLRSWALDAASDSVLLAPAYTFLMRNQPVDYQFWLNVGAMGWAERLYQPLTHPYVLTRGWPLGKTWTDFDEVEANQEALYRLALGLMRRCRKRIYLGFSQLGEQGQEQRGPLLDAVQRTFRRLNQNTVDGGDV